MTDPLSVFLRDLPEDTPRFPWVNHHDVYEKKANREVILKEDRYRSPFLVFLDVPEKAFLEATSAKLCPLHNTRFAYSHEINCLSLQILTPTHEAASAGTSSLFDRKVSEMGLYASLGRPGPIARTYGDVSKQPDMQWLPCAEGEDPNKPTVFLEVATSETQRRVESEAKRWLTYRDSPLMMVIVVKVYREPKIVMQVMAGYRKPQFCMAGQNSESVITRSNGATHVEGTLRLPFEFIFWREKRRENPKEQDVVFNEQDLSDLAESIWASQDFT